MRKNYVVMKLVFVALMFVSCERVNSIPPGKEKTEQIITCEFNPAGLNWDITDATGNPDPKKIEFSIAKVGSEADPYIVIKHNGAPVQCIPPNEKRRWRVWYNEISHRWFFNDIASTATLTPCAAPNFCFRYIESAGILKLSLDKSKDSPGKLLLVCTDDYRNGGLAAVTENKFNIHNSTFSYLKSVHVQFRLISGTSDYAFVVWHNSGQPTVMPACTADGYAPNYACYK